MNIKLVLFLVTFSFSSLTFSKPFSCEFSTAEEVETIAANDTGNGYILTKNLSNGKQLQAFSDEGSKDLVLQILNKNGWPLISSASENLILLSEQSEDFEYIFSVTCKIVHRAAKKILDSDGPSAK